MNRVTTGIDFCPMNRVTTGIDFCPMNRVTTSDNEGEGVIE